MRVSLKVVKRKKRAELVVVDNFIPTSSQFPRAMPNEQVFRTFFQDDQSHFREVTSLVLSPLWRV